MSTDLRALLAAIVADPADDTARLVYADCLEEHGNAPRAAFIRLQVEAERLHPDSNGRAQLEEQAQILFAEHWVDWWGEVCDAVGFLAPVRKPTGTIGRLAQRAGIRTFAGYPYKKASHFGVTTGPGISRGTRLGGWAETAFRRGFPDLLLASLRFHGRSRSPLPRWPACPLSELAIHAPPAELWSDYEQFASVRSLVLMDYGGSVLRAALQPPSLPDLRELSLFNSEYADDVGVIEAFADGVVEEVGWLHSRALSRLALQVWTDGAADAVAGARHLSSLQSLEVNLLPDSSDDHAGAARRMATLARSPNLAGLRELKINGAMNPEGFGAIFQDPTWAGLRKFHLGAEWLWVEPDLLSVPDSLPELEELRLSGVAFSVGQIQAFVRSPLLKRLRHFAVRGGPPQSVDFDIADAVDPDRIETFAIESSAVSPRVAHILRGRLGERFKLLD